MSECYQKLLTSLQSNRQSGATELVLITLSRLKDCLYDIAEQSPEQIEMIVEDLTHARPSMVPLGNVLHRWQQNLPPANSDFKHHYLDSLVQVYQQLSDASDQVAENAADLFKPGMTVMPHSRSSQVMALFEHLLEQHLEFKVIVTMSAPGNEGLLVARQLNRLDVPVTVITDAGMGLVMPEVDINFSGCDSWLTDHHFVNKSGTLLQALAAQHFGKLFWVLADSFKNSHHNSRQITLEPMPADEMHVPNDEFIQALNIYFETISTRLISGRVDEHGVQSGQL